MGMKHFAWVIYNIAVLAFTGWVFYLTNNGWSFLILLCLAFFKGEKNEES